jgi:hypothetical protein
MVLALKKAKLLVSMMFSDQCNLLIELEHARSEGWW